MSNLAKLEITALDISGNNYMRWAVAAKRHLKGKRLLDTIDKSKSSPEEDKANAMIFLTHHIHDGLKDEYITKEDPADLWQALGDRFDHQKYVILPKAKHEWLNLRFQDFKSVAEYNSALFGITSRIMLCGENISDYDMIEKTLQTFHPGNVLLQQQYRAKGYTKYSELMQVLLVAEQNNEIVMLNHQSRPTGSAPFPEVNVTSSNYNNYGHKRGRGNERGRGRGGYVRGRGRGRGRSFHPYNSNNERNNKRFKRNEDGRAIKQHENACYRCGMKGHWSRTCRIDVEHPVPHVHTQNGMAESLIKRLQLIARPLIMRTRLPISVWGHAILHAAALIQIRPSAYHKYSPLQLGSGQKPDISHLRVFGCAVYVPIAPPQRTKMGPQRRLGIYVGFTSPSIIRYLEPQTGDMFTARFADCHFNESEFPALGGGIKEIPKDITWCTPSLLHLDPPTKQRELEVQKIVHLQNLANQLPDAFTDTRRVTKSYIPAANVPSRIDVPEEQTDGKINEPKVQLKRGRPMGSKDKNPRKKKKLGEVKIPEELDTEKSPEDGKSPEDENNKENHEISINYTQNRKIWVRHEIDDDDGIFSFYVSKEIDHESDDPDPRSILECQKRSDWEKWKMAMETELNSLNKRKVFGPIVTIPEHVKPVGYKWVFVRKRNEKNEVTRYKARLVAQGFSQRPGIDYEETYSPVMDAITFRFLMGLAASKNLEMYLMDVVTAYLYGSLDNDIYMRIPEGLKMPEALRSKSKEICAVKLQRSLYGLKQSGRMWYNRLSEYLLSKGYTNNAICPCVFIKKFPSGFVIIAVYVDDLNIIGTPKEIDDARTHMKEEFEMKDLGKTKFCLGLQIEHFQEGIFVHQSNYTKRILKRFNMDKANPLSTPMVNRSLNVENDPFRPCEDNEEFLGPEVPYMSAIGGLMYLANCTRPDIAFATNLLARYNSSPTRRHWNGIKHIFRYLQGTIDLGLYYPRNSEFGLVGFADAGYLSDPHKSRSQTGYVFTIGGTAISWRSQKQTIVATSSNHAEIIALHEACRECVWLRSMTNHIQEASGLVIKREPTRLYEDNAACVAQIKEGYIKSDRTKHIPPRFFSYTQELEKNKEVDVQYIRSSDNAADLFTKALPTSTFRKHVQSIGMRHLRDL
ncbi:Ribonuclease H-like superfamily [Arabidopsis thaliana x Arabidopsis arenosa]|uniref:Ribonuclease H-like superfamily n=1 Tax=Arabidopsis thaliana x Arabidopsis arenosa TaxID=1240361 RepID=A0A8T2B161_9BRAS|nr:Ribonuclease H-like superfamily [Arabidopsis thaliana x Arabidopsis arenosa]